MASAENGVETEGHRPTADELDEQRRQQIAYQYLCHLEEAREWMQACLGDDLPPSLELEECLRNGVYLAKIGNLFAPDVLPLRKIYDLDQERYQRQGLHFRHTDNTVRWLRAMGSLGLPEIFFPETTDVYDKKNMPKAVYCIHALSLYLFKLGLAPQIKDLFGKVKFTEEEINAMVKELAKYGIQLPAFSKIGGILASELPVNEAELHAAIIAINEALDRYNAEDTLRQLQNPFAHLVNLCSENAGLYQDILYQAKQAKIDIFLSKGDTVSSGDVYDQMLTQAEIQGNLNSANVAALIELVETALNNGDFDYFALTVQRSEFGLKDVRTAHLSAYFTEVGGAKQANNKLSKAILQTCINNVNSKQNAEIAKVELLRHLNEALARGNDQEVVQCLRSPALGFSGVLKELEPVYLPRLARERHAKQERSEPSSDLWYDDIQRILDHSQDEVASAVEDTKVVAAINSAVKEHASEEHVFHLLEKLRNPTSLELHGDLQSDYRNSLTKALSLKSPSTDDGKWASGAISDQRIFVNVRVANEYCFKLAPGERVVPKFLTRDEIEEVVSQTNQRCSKDTIAHNVVLLQAQVRGFLARKRLEIVRLNKAAALIQANWKGYSQRTQYKALRDHYQAGIDSIVRVQALVRMWLARTRLRKQLQFYRDNQSSIEKIQRFYRSQKAVKDYHALAHSENPTLGVVRAFLPLLQQTQVDYDEELELEKIKRRVVQFIRTNKEREQDLKMMDLKIGLLVRNSITLQEVVSHGKKLKSYPDAESALMFTPEGFGTGKRQRPVSMYGKDHQRKIEAYQNLLYLLQTKPVYLARLLFAMPANNTTRFMESVVLSLYSYASDRREQYLLVKLFRSALQEEVRSKVDNMADIITGNPLVIKMIVTFSRNTEGETLLRDFLKPVIDELLADAQCHLNTNPLEIYKQNISKQETESGKPAGKPYQVETVEEALNSPEVKQEFEAAIQNLQIWVRRFMNAIGQNVNKVPYGLRYLANVLRVALKDKFPDSSDNEILKVVGNVVYYRYINPSITSPDTFSVLDASQSLTPEQRKKLATVSKVLQFIAANKGYGEQSAYLSVLNPFIKDCHDKFRDYLCTVCNVPEPEEHFGFDEYSDFTAISPPTIVITVGELLNMHQLLLDHENAIAPARDDILHQILNDLGRQKPRLEDFMPGTAGGGHLEAGALEQMQRVEISLTLTSRLEPGDCGSTDTGNLYIRTKRLLIDALPCQTCDTLAQLLTTPVTDTEEEKHRQLMMERYRKDSGAHNATVANEDKLTLEQKKLQIAQNLKVLEDNKIVTAASGYQEIVNALASDIKNKRRHRQQRVAELARLRKALDLLEKKAKFHKEQAASFDQYITSCLENLSASKRKSKLFNLRGTKESGGAAVKSVKYSAAKLRERGMLLDIDGLPDNQWKNVLFEVKSGETAGVFEISAKFLGVDVEHVDLVFQDLLQMQYEGTAIIKLFDRAKVNVNLLIFFLNRKFYTEK